jgi:hypothetical protein
VTYGDELANTFKMQPADRKAINLAKRISIFQWQVGAGIIIAVIYNG